MVSKVAVIALVAIIAVPILLGYAMNLEQVTETDYKTAGDSVNVTPLLTNGVAYTSVQANTYQINSNFREADAPIFPFYEKYTNAYTSMKLSFDVKSDGYIPGGPFYMSNYVEWAWLFEYNSNNGYLNATLTDAANQSTTFNKIHTLYHDYSNNTTYMTVYSTGYTVSPTMQSFNNTASITFSTTGSYYADHTYQWYDRSVDTKYVDISAGYHFSGIGRSPSIILPDGTKSFIMTINLDSIADANYTKLIEIYPDRGAYVARLQLIKTTVDGNVSWQVATGFSLSTITDLYYDPTRNDNTYQLYLQLNDKEKTSETQEKAVIDYSLKYIGGWPVTLGLANPYQSYDFQSIAYAPIANNSYNGLAKISLDQSGGRSPTIRMDAAIIAGYELPVITDQTYDPASFKQNPSTTIGDVTKYGYSFTFGGNTYTVTKGNITLGSRDIPVKGLVLSSTPISGGYENKIGNTVVSTTAQPSTITFNGQWSASISTIAQEEYEYTKTEWHAGSFAWDGVDQNFLMVGLITCLGVFIALGIYARRSGARVLPLMIVCGGAALLFFVML